MHAYISSTMAIHFAAGVCSSFMWLLDSHARAREREREIEKERQENRWLETFSSVYLQELTPSGSDSRQPCIFQNRTSRWAMYLPQWLGLVGNFKMGPINAFSSRKLCSNRLTLQIFQLQHWDSWFVRAEAIFKISKWNTVWFSTHLLMKWSLLCLKAASNWSFIGL